MYATTDFKNIEYLKRGNQRQQHAYNVLNELSIFDQLLQYRPILTGTIPIGIDLPESDLDIICECSNHNEFVTTLSSLYADQPKFYVQTKFWYDLSTTIVTFQTGGFDIEIFGQNYPTENQNAYKHMLIEHKILKANDKSFKAEIIRLKREGFKTEPAFATVLDLDGDPYEELLKLEL